MKIKLDDLSTEVIELIKKQGEVDFDHLPEGLLINTSAGVISYDVDPLRLRQIKTAADLDNYEKFMYEETTTYKNTFQTEMTKGIKVNRAFPSSLATVETENILKGVEISKVKRVNDFLLVKDMNGKIVIFNMKTNKISGEIKVIETLKRNFSIHVTSDDILEFKIYKDGILVSTRYHGVYYIDLKKDTAELIINEDAIVHIEILTRSRMLLISLRGDMFIYETRDFFKVETLYNLKNYGQSIASVSSVNGKLYILGKNMFSHETSNILHIMSETKGGFELRNVTESIYPTPNSRDYDIGQLSVTSDYVVVSGTYKNHPFFWRYDVTNTSLKPLEVINTDIKLPTLKTSTAIGEEVFYFFEDRFVSLDSQGRITRNFRVKGNVEDFILSGNDLYLIKPDGISKLVLENLSYYNDIELVIDNITNINNIEIFVKSTDGTEEIELYDQDKKPITPYVYLKDGFRRSFIQVLGGDYKTITIKINADHNNIIEGIVVGRNHLFLK